MPVSRRFVGGGRVLQQLPHIGVLLFTLQAEDLQHNSSSVLQGTTHTGEVTWYRHKQTHGPWPAVCGRDLWRESSCCPGPQLSLRRVCCSEERREEKHKGHPHVMFSNRKHTHTHVSHLCGHKRRPRRVVEARQLPLGAEAGGRGRLRFDDGGEFVRGVIHAGAVGQIDQSTGGEAVGTRRRAPEEGKPATPEHRFEGTGSVRFMRCTPHLSKIRPRTNRKSTKVSLNSVTGK